MANSCLKVFKINHSYLLINKYLFSAQLIFSRVWVFFTTTKKKKIFKWFHFFYLTLQKVKLSNVWLSAKCIVIVNIHVYLYVHAVSQTWILVKLPVLLFLTQNFVLYHLSNSARQWVTFILWWQHQFIWEVCIAIRLNDKQKFRGVDLKFVFAVSQCLFSRGRENPIVPTSRFCKRIFSQCILDYKKNSLQE